MEVVALKVEREGKAGRLWASNADSNRRCTLFTAYCGAAVSAKKEG